jgi:Protein of unknown function (DUF616).
MNVIYTAISGHYDDLKPHPPIKDCRFIAFVDEPQEYLDEGWELQKLIPFHKDPVRNSKQYKVLAYKMLPQTEYSLWLDGSMIIRDGFDLNALINMFLAEHNIALFSHYKRKCIYREAKTCINSVLDNPSIINKQISKYRSEGYPENHGLTENGVILRRHTPSIALLEELWWKEICEGSRRDQLSLNYSMWKTNTSYAVLPGTQYKNPFFKSCKHRNVRSKFR